MVALLGLGQLGKGGAPALPPLSVGPRRTTGPGSTGVPGPVDGPRAIAVAGGPSPSPIFSGRDPFSLPPQFQTTAGGTTGGATDRVTGGPGPTGSTGTVPDRPVSTGTAPDRPVPRTRRRTARARSIGGHTVVLIDTFTPQRRAKAHGPGRRHVYNPAEGQTFAGGNFELRDVAGNCATFLYGDESFTLCYIPSK